MSEQLVLEEQIGNILRVQLNRPQKKNALLPEMYDGLREALEKADSDDGIQVVFITGSGDSFCAGNDLTTFLDNPESDSSLRFIRYISEAQTPIVACVNGMAVGVGVTMLLHCDLVYASSEAKFNFAFIDLGIVPEAASSYLMPLIVGQRRAAEYLLLGKKFGAEEAQSIGIVNDVYAPDEVVEQAWHYALKLAAKPPQALHLTKQLLKRGTAQAIKETMDAEFGMFDERLRSEEVTTIMQSILARKKA